MIFLTILKVCQITELFYITVKKGEKTEKTEFIKTFDLIDIDEALKIVKNCFNMKNLDEWLNKEKRDEIRVEIKKQIEKITKKG